MTGGYDKILQPLIVDDRFDYVLFSNDFGEKQIGVWQVSPIPEAVSLKDNKRLSRYPKTHPETMLAEYETSLYIDANIQIVDQWVYDRYVELCLSGNIFAGIKLIDTGKDCIYEHSYDMCNNGIEHDYDAIKQCHALYKLGFPKHYGLNENNVIFRRHTREMKKADEEWWWWILNYSFRDQFSYMYCLWKYNIPIDYFLPIGEYCGNTAHFNRILHDNHDNVKKTKYVKMSVFEKARLKCRMLNERNNKRYLSHWLILMKMPYPQCFLMLWGIAISIINAPVKVYRMIKCRL